MKETMRGLALLFRGLRAPGATPEVPAKTLAEWLERGERPQILDLRDAAAFRAGHLPGARHVPLERLEQTLPSLDRQRATVLY